MAQGAVDVVNCGRSFFKTLLTIASTLAHRKFPLNREFGGRGANIRESLFLPYFSALVAFSVHLQQETPNSGHLSQAHRIGAKPVAVRSGLRGRRGEDASREPPGLPCRSGGGPSPGWAQAAAGTGWARRAAGGVRGDGAAGCAPQGSPWHSVPTEPRGVPGGRESRTELGVWHLPGFSPRHPWAATGFPKCSPGWPGTLWGSRARTALGRARNSSSWLPPQYLQLIPFHV